jgi:hypothetical protein
MKTYENLKVDEETELFIIKLCIFGIGMECGGFEFYRMSR